jgi:hypothetical protein
MADARINVFADAVVAALQAGLPAGDDTDVEWSLSPEVLGPDFDPAALPRRTVYVVPVTRSQTDGGTRELDQYEYAVLVLVANRFAGAAGDPTKEWVRGEMAWQERQVDDLLSNERTASVPAAVAATGAFVTKSDPAYAYDVEAVQTQRLFLALQVFAFSKAG